MTDDTQTENTPKRGRALAAWQDFEAELHQREQSIIGLLPQNVSKQKFINSTIAAIKQTPDLLTATPRSLFAAIAKSAQDGLLPDGREGVITIYNEKQKDGSYQKVAQWNPMTHGLRKRARELDGILINAQVVHENDLFVREEGDEPKIEHKPAQLGSQRGKMIGAYAVFRNASGILHREVMDAAQIESVQAQSKAPGSLMWTKFQQEAWRKTVIRRGIKSVPVSEPLEQIARRDDDLFNFDAEPNGKGRRQPANVIQPPADGERKALPPVVGEAPPLAETESATLLAEIPGLETMAACENFAQKVTRADGLTDAEFREIGKALMARQQEIAKNPGNGHDGGDDPKKDEPDGGKSGEGTPPVTEPKPAPEERHPAARDKNKAHTAQAAPERGMADLMTAG